MGSNYESQWQENRISFITNIYGTEFFRNKRILELGPFNGYIGYTFSTFGATVHCLEGRLDNVNNIKRDYPTLTVERADLDTTEWNWGEWDVIINFGLYYHLEKHHNPHLVNCIRNCKLMFFETVVYDSAEPEIYFRSEVGSDQSLTDVGGNPSTSYIENIFTEENVAFTKYTTPALNGSGHHYDWIDRNSKSLDTYARRFWIVNNSGL